MKTVILQTETQVIFKKDFETRKEARAFFNQYAEDNNFLSCAYKNIKLGFYDRKQVDLLLR